MYIIAVEKETGPTEVLKNGNEFIFFDKEALKEGLEHAAEKYGANNISCFKEAKITIKADVTFIEE